MFSISRSQFDLFLFTQYAHSNILYLIEKQLILSEKRLVVHAWSEREIVCF